MFSRWLRSLFGFGRPAPQQAARQARRRPSVEALEQRDVPATIVVNSLLDNTNPNDAKVTLREAIKAANNDTVTDLGDKGSGADTITFDHSLFANGTATITLSESPTNDQSSLGAAAFVITTDITIQGPAATGGTDNRLTIEGGGANNAFRFATVSSAGSLTLKGLTLTNFYAQGGDGARNISQAGGGGGGAGLGGALLNYGGTLALDGVTLEGNTAAGGNGANGGSNSTTTSGSGGGGGGVGTDASGATAGGPGSAGGFGAGGPGLSGTVSHAGFGGGGGGSRNTAGGNGGFGGGGGGGQKGTSFSNGFAGGLAGFGGGMGQSGMSRQTVSGAQGAGGGGAGMGGAIFNLGGTTTIVNSTLASNSAVGGSRGAGGTGTPGASGGVGSTFRAAQLGWNDAAGMGAAAGGAVFSLNGSLTITNSTVSDNTLTSANPTTSGRAIFVYSGNPQGGYALGSTSAAVSMTNTILGQSDNTIPDYQTFGTVTESGSNNLVRNNVKVPATTLSAAPAAPNTTTISIASASALGTVTNNSTVLLVDGEQMLVTGGANTTSLTVTRGYNGTLAAQHSNGARVFNLTDTSSPAFTGGALSGDDPGLGTLADNGGPTLTLKPGAGSPAIANGTSSGAPSVDQRGVARGSAVDIGAVQVTAAATAPVIAAGQTFSPPEGLAPGDEVGTVAVQGGPGQQFAFELVQGNEAGLFQIGNDGKIVVAPGAKLDFEGVANFQLGIKVSDAGNPALSSTATVSISITDVDEPPVIANQSFSTFTTAANGSVVGSVVASDPEGKPVTYSIVGGNNGAFAIDPATGTITVVNSSLLQPGAAQLTVQVSDGSSPDAGLLVFEPFDYTTRTLNNANGGTGWANNWGVRTSSNEADDLNGSYHFVAGSPALGPNDTTAGVAPYTIDYPAGTAELEATGGAAWRLQNGGGQFYERRDFAAPLGDSEGAVTRWMSFLIAPVMTVNHGGFSGIRLVSSGGSYDGFVGWGGGANAWQVGAFGFGGTNATGQPGPEDADLAVGSNNDGLAAPTFLVAKMEFSGDGTADTLSLWVNPSASDLDSAADAVYNSVNFGSFTGVYLQGNYGSVKDEVRIGTTAASVIGGASGLKSTAIVTVTVARPNSPPSIEDQAFRVNENSAGGAFVGLVAASDPDEGQSLTYQIVGGTGAGLFEIDQATGAITVATDAELDYESASSYTLIVKASDDHEPAASATATMTVNINDVKELQSFTVQGGQQQRSYIRTLDLVFESAAGLQDLISSGRVKLLRYGLDGSGSGVDVNLATALSVNGNALKVDFGVEGLGGSRNSSTGDGYYRLVLDLDGDGSFETAESFHRLLGDANGDRAVSQADLDLYYRNGVMNVSAGPDINGDGRPDSTDVNLIRRAMGRRVTAPTAF